MGQLEQLGFEFDFIEEKPTKKRAFNKESNDAHESIKESKQVLWDKITDGLIKLKIGGNYEEIAHACGLRPDQVCKRLSEMDSVYNTGIKRKTSSGRFSMVRQLKELKY